MSKLATTHKIIVGRFGTPYGLQGWIKVNSYTRPTDNIVNYQPWLLEVKGTYQPVTIAAHKVHGKSIIVQVEGCNDRETAANYTNINIAISRQQLPELAQNEYYWSDLEGLTVINHDNARLGVIDHIMSTGANDVLVVKGERVHAIPYLDDVIVNIDLNEGTMHVRWDIED